MFNLNKSLKPQDVLGNIFNMRYPFNNGQLSSNNGNGNGNRGQRGPRNETRGTSDYNGAECVKRQNYLEQVIKYQQIQLQHQQQQLLYTQQQYEYNLQLQYQYQMQQQLNQNLINLHQNPSLHNQLGNIAGALPPPLDLQTYQNSESIYPGVCYSSNQEELQVIEPYEILIIPKYDNTVTVRNVSHVDLSKNKSSRSKEMEIEVEIKKGDQGIELESIRDELLSEKKISVDSEKNQEIEVNVYETRSCEEVTYSESVDDQELKNLCTDSLNSSKIEVDLMECYNHEIQDEQILGSESELEEVCLNDDQAEIEIEEDSVLVIKYKNDNAGVDILDLMEQNIDNCVIDGNSYYYENFVRSFSSGNYSSYENQIEPNLLGFGGNYCYLLNNDSTIQSRSSSKLFEILEDEDEEQEEKEDKEYVEESKVEDHINEIEEREEEEIHTKSEISSSINDKESLEELNDKIQRFNLLLEKINKMEQMNISFKEAFLSEKWNLNSNSEALSSDLSNKDRKTDGNQSEDNKSISEYSNLDTVKDIYDSNPHVIYKDSGNVKCESSSEKLADVDSEVDQSEEQVQKYIQAINDYFAREGLLGTCESRLNTHRWERNYESAMSSLNSQFKDSSYNSDAVSESVIDSVSNSGIESEVEIVKDETKNKQVNNTQVCGIDSKCIPISTNELEETLNNELIKSEFDQEKKYPKQDLTQTTDECKQSLQQHYVNKSQLTIIENSGAHLIPVNLNNMEDKVAPTNNSASRTVLVSNEKKNVIPSTPTKNSQKVKIPPINIPNSNDISKKVSSSSIFKESQLNLKKQGKNVLHATSQKNSTLAGNDSNKESTEKDDEILARLSQCRVVNSKTIKQSTNYNNSLNANTNSNINGNGRNTINFRQKMNTCSVSFSSSNNSSPKYNNFNQHANKNVCEKMTRGPVYNINNNSNINNFAGKCTTSQNRPQVPVQVRKEPNLGFKSLINNGIKVNVTELMKPRIIRR